MMIILSILKILLTIILVLLGIIVLLLLIILFVPIRYKGKGNKDNEAGIFKATIEAGWLLNLLHFHGEYDKHEGLGYRARALWFKLIDSRRADDEAESD